MLFGQDQTTWIRRKHPIKSSCIYIYIIFSHLVFCYSVLRQPQSQLGTHWGTRSTASPWPIQLVEIRMLPDTTNGMRQRRDSLQTDHSLHDCEPRVRNKVYSSQPWLEFPTAFHHIVCCSLLQSHKLLQRSFILRGYLLSRLKVKTEAKRWFACREIRGRTDMGCLAGQNLWLLHFCTELGK